MWIARSACFCLMLIVIGAFAAATPARAQSSNLKLSALTAMPLVMTRKAVDLSTAKVAPTKWENEIHDLTHLPQRTVTRTPYSCTAESIVCYDVSRGQAVVPLTKSLMPNIPGLTKVGLTVKRSGVNLRYSF